MNTKKDILFAAHKIKNQLVYNMAKAEGNTHSFAEVSTVIEGFTIQGKKFKEAEQIVQINKAWEYLFELIEKDKFVFNKQTALELNQLAASADYSKVGCFRDREVQISSTEYRPPLSVTVPNLWDDLTKKTKDYKNHRQAAYNVFLDIARNQIFNDGNKRTGQLMMNGILMSNNFHIVTFPDKIRGEYTTKLIQYYETGHKSEMLKLLDSRQKRMELAFVKQQSAQEVLKTRRGKAKKESGKQIN